LSSLTPGEVPDEWDFYPCRVNDGPASLALNLWFRENAPIAAAPTLYWVAAFMADPDEHGMGSTTEAEHLFSVTDPIVVAAAAKGLYQVGRLRNNGCWQLTFYGASGLEEELGAIAKESNMEREYDVGSKADLEWRYYFDFLCPDSERWQWIMDRRVVELLEEKGDSLSKERPVDHCLYFPGAAERDLFIAAAQAKGFELVSEFANEESDALPFGIEINRTDSVRLDNIHAIVMELSALAAQWRGDYDGWGTSVESES
jgi:uncharacterized protein (TIGR01619 family)